MDSAFLRSPTARTLALQAELLEPQYRLEREGIEDTIVFFGSARIPASPEQATHPGLTRLAGYYAAAQELARRLTEWDQRLRGGRRFVICSGGGPGIMEAATRGAAEGGGRAIGYSISIPGEQGNRFITPELHFLFHYFFIRKFWFVYNAKALVFFPGGFGTMDELMEVLTLVQTGRVRKKMGIVLFGSEFWNEVLNFDALVRHGVISDESRRLVTMVDSVDDAFARLSEFLQENYGASLLAED